MLVTVVLPFDPVIATIFVSGSRPARCKLSCEQFDISRYRNAGCHRARDRRIPQRHARADCDQFDTGK